MKAEVQGFKELAAKLIAMVAVSGADVEVGYSAAYAPYVHEDLEAYHVTGEAKFLERPARELRPELMTIILRALANGATVQQALLLAGLRLQVASQKLVPVDTGYLRGSAYTKVV